MDLGPSGDDIILSNHIAGYDPGWTSASPGPLMLTSEYYPKHIFHIFHTYPTEDTSVCSLSVQRAKQRLLACPGIPGTMKIFSDVGDGSFTLTGCVLKFYIPYMRRMMNSQPGHPYFSIKSSFPKVDYRKRPAPVKEAQNVSQQVNHPTDTLAQAFSAAEAAIINPHTSVAAAPEPSSQCSNFQCLEPV